jgi:hypothetical protein
MKPTDNEFVDKIHMVNNVKAELSWVNHEIVRPVKPKVSFLGTSIVHLSESLIGRVAVWKQTYLDQ